MVLWIWPVPPFLSPPGEITIPEDESGYAPPQSSGNKQFSMARKVAIVGFSFRLPGTTPERFWADLQDSRDLVSEVHPQRWEQRTFLHPYKRHPGTSYTFAAGSIGDALSFDAGFFGISPREAALMDPQQRLLLELTWEAIEHAGVRAEVLRGSDCGVYIGIAGSDYGQRLIDDLGAIDSTVATGNTSSIAANRISYFLDLHGPSLPIDTACSSSLVAFHHACRAILSGECSQALTGGVSLHFHPLGFIAFSKANMLSPTGRCKVFSGDGDGYVRSEGGGIFLLKELGQALADGNEIHAVVANSRVNTDGHKQGLTVPNPLAQASLLEKAYQEAGISPVEIDYLEAHGTGTQVGDPIEAQAIGVALGQHRPRDLPLPIGSVKSNLGHLETASGVAGLIKALYCLRQRLVPANIHLDKPNPHIPFHELNIRVVDRHHPLKAEGRIVIGVNSFGFGGANAHVILTSTDGLIAEREATAGSGGHLPLPVLISARNPAALRAAARALADTLANLPQERFYDLAYSSVFHRDHHPWRAVSFCLTSAQAGRDLAGLVADEGPDAQESPIESGTALTASVGPAFIYSGNGSQWEGMGQGLLADAGFLDAVRAIDALFQPLAGFSLEDELAGRNGSERLSRTEIAQPALFAIQVGLTCLLRERGITPTAVCGHSVGEVAAAWAAGILSLEAAVAVIFHRSRLQGKTKGYGQMTAASLSQEEAQVLLAELGLTDTLVIAGINSPRAVTLAGNPIDLDQIEARLAARDLFYRRLDLDYAFHSPAMDIIEAGIQSALANLAPVAGEIPFFSTVTGGRLSGELLDAAYWWQNIREPVLFNSALTGILQEGTNVFIEIGPHPVLQGYVTDCLRDHGLEGRLVRTLVRNDDAPERVWRALAQVIILGLPFDWARYFTTRGQPVALPHYPWQREPLMHPVSPEADGMLHRRWVHPLLGFALPQQELTWLTVLDTQIHPIYADHVIGETTLFPGAGFVELALAAALAWQPTDYAEIEGLEIRLPVFLSDQKSMILRTSVDPHDGRLSIKGREQGSGDAWTLHAVGRIRREPRGLALRLVTPSLPERSPDFTAADHERLTRRLGLDYGPAFKAIDQVWVEDDLVVARLAIPAAVEAELADVHLHPAVLDNAFQLVIELLADAIERHEDIGYLPTGMGQIYFRPTKSRPAIAQARLMRLSPHSLVAEFALFGADGTPIALIREGRFRGVMRLRKGGVNALRFLDYHAVPCPHPMTPQGDPVISYRHAEQLLQKTAQICSLADTHLRYSGEVEPLLDSLCSLFSVSTLRHLASPEGRLSPGWAQASGNTAYADYLLGLAQEDNRLAGDANEGWHFINEGKDQISAESLWNLLVADYPEYFPLFLAVGRVGLHLADLLADGVTLEQVLPREGTRSALIRQVLGRTARQKIGLALRELIGQGLRQLAPEQRLGILEVSQGVPLFAHDIGAAVDFRRCDYRFASPSAEALEEADRLREHHAGMEVSPFDQPISGSSPSYQLAVCILDFDSLDLALNALNYIRNRLAVNGSLLLIGCHSSRWVDFCFGGQADWWQGVTTTNSAQQPGPAFWQERLGELGFAPGEICELSPETFSGPYLLAGQLMTSSPEVTGGIEPQPRQWLFLVDGVGDSSELANALRKELMQYDEAVTFCQCHDREGIVTALERIRAEAGPVAGVLHLAGLELMTGTNSTSRIFDKEVRRCSTAAALIQACEQSQTNAICWLVTVGATTHLLPSAAEPYDVAYPAPDACLWGFGRTLTNEVSNYSVRLIDLEMGTSLGSLAQALARELLHQDGEQEVILTATGQRYAPRLGWVERPVPINAQVPPIAAPTIRLGFQFPGQLRNLRWAPYPRVAPGPGEIEVGIRATGLNFRDVMYALGLLSDEAVENGFAGPTLGMEFAGEVLQIGSEVKGLCEGDRVVGFAPSCFANRMVVNAAALSVIPQGIPYEAAATIPTAFFTAYYALCELARLQAGERILIHGAAGGVGIAAIQVAKWIGAEIFATAGSNEKRDFLRLFGIKHIYDSRSLAFAEEILEQTGGVGVDVVLNSLAGEAMTRSVQVLSPFGRFLELGKRDYYENTHLGLRPFRNNITYFGIDADQLFKERPAVTRRLFHEMMDMFQAGHFHPLPYHQFDAADVVDAFRYMQQAKQIGKILVTYEGDFPHLKSSPLRPGIGLSLSAKGTYLVTGGLRGFGLKAADWLATKGAQHLVLISRSGPTGSEAVEAIKSFEERGIRVCARACDVTDETALTKLLNEIRENLPPLRGLIHAATVYEDSLIRNTDEAQIARVFAVKMLGASHLHRLTLEDPLDFFVLFSSASTLFGNPGQGNYVAANYWLEALARERRRLGRPATAILWGPIDDVGFLARNQAVKDALQGRLGTSAIPSAVALDAFEEILLADRTGLGVMEINWRTLARFLPSASSPKFREIARHASRDGNEDDDLNELDIRRLLAEQSDEELRVTFTEMIRAEIAEILHISPEKIDHRRSIFDMGLDSLMGMELLVAMEGRFGVRLPTMSFSEAPTIERLADRILHHLRNAEDEEMDDQKVKEPPVPLNSAPPDAVNGRLGQDLQENYMPSPASRPISSNTTLSSVH